MLSVDLGRHALDLVLDPTRPATRPGDAGRVELVPGSAHLWVQEEQLAARGRWRDGRETRWVEGVGFYKHQWGRLYDPELDGFTWISMDLDAATSLSVAWLHDDGLRGVPGSMAWLSTEEGPVPLPVEALRLTPERVWRGRTGASWPVAWLLEGPGIELRVEALADDQELRVAPAPLHVGPARARGELFGRPVDGVAFLEQAGARVPPTRALYRSDAPEAP